jgi:hypothetical protein
VTFSVCGSTLRLAAHFAGLLTGSRPGHDHRLERGSGVRPQFAASNCHHFGALLLPQKIRVRPLIGETLDVQVVPIQLDVPSLRTGCV